MRSEVGPIERTDALAMEAIEWFLRIEREEPTLDTLAAWQQWLEMSPQNRTEYEAAQKTWRKLDSVNPREELARAAEKRRQQRPVNKHVIGALLASAAAVAGIIIWGFGRDLYRADISTHVAEHRELTLPDRSHVVVGARSEIEVVFSNAHRKVRLLSGEAFFDVAKDATRPFVVDAGLSEVIAVGTAFNVRRYQDAVAVEVTEGRVRLDRNSSELHQGQEVVLTRGGKSHTARSLPVSNMAAWRRGQHSYIDTPLALVIADLNRYAIKPILFDDPALGTLRITTTFFSDDWRGWLATLEAAMPSIALRDAHDEVHIAAKSDAAQPDSALSAQGTSR